MDFCMYTVETIFAVKTHGGVRYALAVQVRKYGTVPLPSGEAAYLGIPLLLFYDRRNPQSTARPPPEHLQSTLEHRGA